MSKQPVETAQLPNNEIGNKAMLTIWLKTLQSLTNVALEEAKQQPRETFANDPINWADLRCIQASKSIDQNGFEDYEVVISEAGPDAHELKNYVRSYLKNLISQSVIVRTEW